MNAAINTSTWDDYETMLARTIQLEEYFTTGQISTNFLELIEEVSEALWTIEMERLAADRGAFCIMGTRTIH